MKEYIINENQINDIIKYLSGCPFGQVFKLVEILTNLPPVVEAQKAEEQEDGV